MEPPHHPGKRLPAVELLGNCTQDVLHPVPHPEMAYRPHTPKV